MCLVVMGYSAMGLCVIVAEPVCDRALCVTWLCVGVREKGLCVCEVELCELRF